MTENGTERTLGLILGKLEGIDRRLDSADTSRARLHEKVAGVMGDVTAIKAKTDTIDGRVDLVKADIEVFKPHIDLVRDMKSKAAAAVVILAGLGAFFAWLIGVLIGPLLSLFR